MRLVDSPLKGKKWRAIFKDNSFTDFGAIGYDDFTTFPEEVREERKKRYLKRHSGGRENWNDPYSAGALSRWILWNEPTIEKSLRDYRRRFPNV
jgi:hypothetical protein